jgi:metallo-beta-lactamase family protein
VPIAPGVKATFAEAGHMLGSASIQLTVEEDGREKKVVFSGDLGPISAPLLRQYEPFHAADMVFLESTYGDHDHRPFRGTVEEFVEIVKTAAATHGTILIPTFAVGRAQLLVVLYIQEKPLREDLKTLTPCATARQSKAIDQCPGPCLVMAGSGMCNAGRILHHLKQNVGKPETSVLMVGYQAQGTVGRRLVDGATHVKIFGEKIAVKATVRTLGGFSAHAGQTDLLGWVDTIAPSRPLMVLTHGEDPQRQALARCIRKQYRLRTLLPMQGDTIEV